MPIERFSDRYHTYFAKKFIVYFETNRQQRHIHGLGIPNFRMLTVTTTPERVAQMRAALDALTGGKGSNMFLFADSEQLAASSPVAMRWTSGKGGLVRIGD